MTEQSKLAAAFEDFSEEARKITPPNQSKADALEKIWLQIEKIIDNA